MNTQNITGEIASNALAELAAALDSGNSSALIAYLQCLSPVSQVFLDQLSTDRDTEMSDIVR